MFVNRFENFIGDLNIQQWLTPVFNKSKDFGDGSEKVPNVFLKKKKRQPRGRPLCGVELA